MMCRTTVCPKPITVPGTQAELSADRAFQQQLRGGSYLNTVPHGNVGILHELGTIGVSCDL